VEELRAFGFHWYDGDSLELDDTDALDNNYELAAKHFNLRDLPKRVAEILGD
jgi:hypothetical protein